MILVVGSTGQLGTAICRRLRDKGLPVRALVRSTSDSTKVDYLHGLGVETVPGNLKDRTSLDVACKGVQTVVTTATITLSRQPDDTIQNVDQAGQINLVDAANAAGVPYFMFLSYSKNLDTDSPLTTAKRSVEQHLMQSGMAYTILRPSFFMEVWLSPAVGFDYASAKATIFGTGHNKISWISRGDVASFAITALNHPGAHNAILELGGPGDLSPLEVVRIFEQAAGKSFDVQHVPEQALRDQKLQATDSVQQSFSGLMLDYAKGDVIDMTATLRQMSLKLLTVEDYAKRIVSG